MSPLFHRLWRPGIRLQLMFWYTTVFVGVLLIIGAIFSFYLEGALETSLDTPLRIQATQVCEEVDEQNQTLIIHNSDLMGFFSNQPLPSGNGGGSSNEDLGKRVVRLLDVHGKVLRETPGFQSLNMPASSIMQPLQGKDWMGTITTSDGDAMRFYSRALMKQGTVIAVVQLGQSLSSLYLLLHQLVATLLEVGAVALLICAVSSYWLTKRAFSPIQHLTETARRIKAGDLHQRIPLPSAHDEIRHLALTLNEMLDALDSTF